MKWTLLPVLMALSSCAEFQSGVVTLYRNGSVDTVMRIHFASFDADDGINYNLANCQMTARILNANVSALAKSTGGPRNAAVGFWCEVGIFKEQGRVPPSFDEEYPTDAQ